MKAVIVELRGEYAAALSDDGCVRRIRNNQYAVGQTIELEAKRHLNSRLILRAASAAAAVLLLGTSAWAYYTPYSYVSLDVNPSIEYSLNRFDRVLRCSAVNGDGAEIVEGLRLNHKDIQDAIKLTIQKMAEEGYLSGEETGNIMIAASSKHAQKSDALAAELEETAEETVKEEKLEVDLEAVGVGQEYVEQAKERGVTPGKFVLVQRLQESAGEETAVAVEDWLDESVKDIMKQIKENKEMEKDASAAGQDKNKNDVDAGEEKNGPSAADGESATAADKSNGKENHQKETKDNGAGRKGG